MVLILEDVRRSAYALDIGAPSHRGATHGSLLAVGRGMPGFFPSEPARTGGSVR
jgi:hypothetical protein